MKTLDLYWMKQYDWALVGSGEGAICMVVPGSTFGDELHDFFCCCDRRECNNETAAEVLEEMKDSANWTFDEGGLPYSYSMQLEQAGVEIVRVSKIIRREGTL
jgi:hypothetical protein